MARKPQIPEISVQRASNAAHYEYMRGVVKRAVTSKVENELFLSLSTLLSQRVGAEDEAYKQLTASSLTDDIKTADAARDELYRALHKVVMSYEGFPVAELAEAAKPLVLIVKNYKLDTTANYIAETGAMENFIQDMQKHAAEVKKLQLEQVLSDMDVANKRVRRILSERNDERMTQVQAQLLQAREACDETYLELVQMVNALHVVYPADENITNVFLQLNEDLDYFRKHAMTNPNRSRNAAQKTDSASAKPAQQDGTTTTGDDSASQQGETAE